jgi:hypothetical protein
MELLFALRLRKPRGYSLITVLCEACLSVPNGRKIQGERRYPATRRSNNPSDRHGSDRKQLRQLGDVGGDAPGLVACSFGKERLYFLFDRRNGSSKLPSSA